MVRWLVGVALGLTALHAILVILWGTGQPVAVLPWYVPMMHSFAALAALGIAFLAFGRYRVLREPASFWTGTAFVAFALLAPFYVLSWPGLLPDDRGLIAELPNTSGWLLALKFSALALFLLVAPLAPWPRAGVTREGWWFWPVIAEAITVVAIASIGWLAVAFEQSLPLLVVDGVFTPLFIGWFFALLVAFAAGALLSIRRYRQTGDSLLGYAAITQLALAFYVLTSIIGGQRYDTWWYWRRILMIGGFSAMLFGMLSEYVALYRREQKESNRLRVLVNTAPVGIGFYSAPDGRPELLNSAAENILGRLPPPIASAAQQAAIYGATLPDGRPFPPEDLPVARSLRGESSVGVEMLVRQPSGRQVYLLLNSAPLRDAGGRIVGAVIVFQDITAIKEQERLRDEFLTTAAHELRTPVSIIKGYVQMMRRWAPGGHEPREGQAIDVIDTQCDRIARRVEEMLEVVRTRVAPPELHRTLFDLGDLASEVVRRMQAKTEIHRLHLRREGPAAVEADRERIEEVLTSLLDNALKYSPGGGDVEVRVRAEGPEAVASVADQGVGIARERQPHIFEPFYLPVPPGAPGYLGVAALSLYLSKLTVERHGGRVWFESEQGKGSTFHFSLPLAEGTQQAA